jgi:hypothetical protein
MACGASADLPIPDGVNRADLIDRGTEQDRPEKGMDQMTALMSRCGVLLAVTLMASAAIAAGAQAQAVWSPDNTAVFGISEDPILAYEDTTIRCDSSTLSGATGVGSPILDLEQQFFGNCAVGGFGATVDCAEAESLRLIALDPVDNTGTVDLNPGYSCVVTVTGVCTISIDGPQSDVGVFVLDEAADVLTIDVDDAAATRSGSSLCGPASGTALFAGDYQMSPSELAIVP